MRRSQHSMSTTELLIADLKPCLKIKNQQFFPIPCYLRRMTRAASFAGLILAAGDSSRMGRDKALLPWPPLTAGQALSSDTFLSAAIRSLLQATDFVLVVVGKNEATLAPIIYSQGASLIVNPDPSRGQFSSLQVGLHEVLNQGRDAAMVTLIDRPPVSASTLETLRDAFEASDQLETMRSYLSSGRDCTSKTAPPSTRTRWCGTSADWPIPSPTPSSTSPK